MGEERVGDQGPYHQERNFGRPSDCHIATPHVGCTAVVAAVAVVVVNAVCGCQRHSG